MFRSLILAAVLMAATPLIANAGEITLLPSIKLQIGDRDNYGNYWDGGGWRDRDYWHRHYQWRDRGWHRYDYGRHRGWDNRRAYERGYRDGRHDDRGHGWGHGHGHRH
jgi:Protein of unknown function (DUF2502).